MDGLEKPYRKSGPKNRKNSKNQIEIAAREQKTTSQKAKIFLQTPFSNSTLKLVRKIFTPQNHSLFRTNVSA